MHDSNTGQCAFEDLPKMYERTEEAKRCNNIANHHTILARVYRAHAELHAVIAELSQQSPQPELDNAEVLIAGGIITIDNYVRTLPRTFAQMATKIQKDSNNG